MRKSALLMELLRETLLAETGREWNVRIELHAGGYSEVPMSTPQAYDQLYELSEHFGATPREYHEMNAHKWTKVQTRLGEWEAVIYHI